MRVYGASRRELFERLDRPRSARSRRSASRQRVEEREGEHRLPRGVRAPLLFGAVRAAGRDARHAATRAPVQTFRSGARVTGGSVAQAIPSQRGGCPEGSSGTELARRDANDIARANPFVGPSARPPPSRSDENHSGPNGPPLGLHRRDSGQSPFSSPENAKLTQEQPLDRTALSPKPSPHRPRAASYAGGFDDGWYCTDV